MKKKILKNGLNILVYNMPNTHSITVGLYIKSGQAYGDESVVGITHLLEHLHFRRLGDMDQNSLYYEMESMGSSLRAATYRDFLKFTMKITQNNLEGCIKIFSNLINAYEWTENEFQQEKQVVLNQIIEKGNYISLEKETRKIVFKGHPLKNDIMGEVEDIELLQKNDVVGYKRKIFNSENMLLCITGNLSELDCKKIVDEFQKGLLLTTFEERKVHYPPNFHCRKPDLKFVYVQDENPLEINITFDVTYNEESKGLLTILNCILGEGVGSKLQKRIREEKCFTSDIASYIEWYQNFAVLHIGFTVEKKRLLCCFNEVAKVIQEMKEHITERDLSVSLPFYTTNQIFYEDDTEEMNFQLAYHELVLNMDHKISGIKNDAETCERLKEFAKQIFVKNNVSVIVLGNTNKITKKSILELVDKF